MEKIIFDVVATGNLEILQGLLQQDSLLLETTPCSSYGRTLLHIAVDHGHFDIVKEIASRKVQLVELPDLRGWTPLHLASAKGHVRIVKLLSSVALDTCFLLDYQGRNPIHVAVVKGNLELIKILVKNSPVAAREKTNRNESMLHLCVKHSRLEVLKFLVRELKDIIDACDDEGNGILHLAIMHQQVEMVRYLVESTSISKNMRNFKGKTPLDYAESSEIRKIFEDEALSLASESKIWIDKSRDIIMVVAVLISTMAFQAVITPPGGFSQDNHNRNRMGEPLMASMNPVLYKKFIQHNILAFFASFGAIMLLISGLCTKWRIFRWVLIAMMWLSLANIGGTFTISIKIMSPEWNEQLMGANLVLGIFFWIGVLVTHSLLINDRRIVAWLKTFAIFGTQNKVLPR